MGDRETGKLVSVTLWESEEALRASEEAADQLRADAADRTGGAIASVERFEVFAQA
jgi:heme-degrading monooxygenase HmoA